MLIKIWMRNVEIQTIWINKLNILIFIGIRETFPIQYTFKIWRVVWLISVTISQWRYSFWTWDFSVILLLGLCNIDTASQDLIIGFISWCWWCRWISKESPYYPILHFILIDVNLLYHFLWTHFYQVKIIIVISTQKYSFL